MRGRKPKPTALKLVTGNPGKRPINRLEPKPDASVMPSCPEWLDADAKAEWLKTGPILFRLGILTEADVTAFAAYCRSFGMWKEADANIRKIGMIVATNKGPVINPWYHVATQSLKEVKAFGVEFGITPSSRSRLAVKPTNVEEDADAANFG